MGKRIFVQDDTPTPPPLYPYPVRVEPQAYPPARRTKAPKTLRILLIEDNPGDARLIRESLFEVPSTSFEFQHADRLTSGLDILARGNVDLVLLDLSLPESWGIDTLLRVQGAAPTVPVVVLTGLDDEEAAITAVQEGAQDYMVKGQVTSSLLVRSIRYAIERSRRRQAERELRATNDELRIAQEIQRKLFPAAPPQLQGLDIGGASYPAVATGGDYFDYVRMAGDYYGFIVGDVAGHGFGPALLMAEVRAYLRALVWTHQDVNEILLLANRLLVEDVAEDHFVTLFLGRIDPRTRTFVYASAGHPNAYILGADGQLKFQLKSTGFPLGLERDASFSIAPPTKLSPGDLVVLPTDGVFEAASPDDHQYGVDRMLEHIRDNRHLPAKTIVASLYESICEFCRGQKPKDDITAIVIKVLTGA